MVNIVIDFDAEKAIQAMKTAPQRTARGTARALNRALTTGRALMAREIAKDLGLKSADAKDAISTEEARPDKLQVRMAASLQRIPLIKFGASGPEPSLGKGRGVSYKIGVRPRSRIANAFIATMKSGHRGVFTRAGKARLPLAKEKAGPSIGHVFGQKRPEVVTAMQAAFEARLDHELAFAATEDR